MCVGVGVCVFVYARVPSSGARRGESYEWRREIRKNRDARRQRRRWKRRKRVIEKNKSLKKNYGIL